MRAVLLAPLVLLCACSLRVRERADFNAALLLVQKEYPVFARGLKSSPLALTLPEHESIMRLVAHDRVASLIYIDRHGETRWVRETGRLMMCTWTLQTLEFATAAPDRAVRTKAPAYARTGSGALEVAVPVVVKGKVLGAIVLQYAAQSG